MPNPSSPLSDQVAVVTGASRGIGAAIAGKLAGLGMQVVITGRDRKALGEVEERIAQQGGRCEGRIHDVTSLADITGLATYIDDGFGRLDVLVNNAGVGLFGTPLHEMQPADWDRIMDTNLRGVFYCIRALAPMMIRQGGGHIINISSIASKNPVANGAAYAASKWGLNGLSYSVAEELRNYGVRVSVVCPGSTDTGLRRAAAGDTSRMLLPDDIAHAVAMLVVQAPQSFVSEIVVRPTRKP
ncbi:MAG TPA: SDR family NAD(P)-dependent oxidoreductase [Clostridia bacterium]|nr:SDR family NAD(P)-dependent oxidoreductase [Clostridia bacterium]